MVSYDPKLVRENAEFNKAVDACHKAGVGLISMKEMRAVDAMPKMLPGFRELGLTPHQAVLHAAWTDERIANHRFRNAQPADVAGEHHRCPQLQTPRIVEARGR